MNNVTTAALPVSGRVGGGVLRNARRVVVMEIAEQGLAIVLSVVMEIVEQGLTIL